MVTTPTSAGQRFLAESAALQTAAKGRIAELIQHDRDYQGY